LKKISTQNVDPVVTTKSNNDSIYNNEHRIVVLPYVNPISKFIAANIDKTKAIIGFRCLNKLSQ